MKTKIFVGVDWGSEVHQACALDEAGELLGEKATRHGGAGLEELCAWLAKLAEPSTVAVAIETPYGPVVEALLERGFSTFAINPKQMDRCRDRFTVAGVKDDRFDARVLGDSLRTDRADRSSFRKLRVEDPIVIELREWSRMVEEQQEERQRLANRIRGQLWRYYPQMLELADDVTADWFLELWKMAPTPASVKHLRRNKVEALLKNHRIRRLDADAVLSVLKQKPLSVAAGTTEAASAHITTLIERLVLLNTQHRGGLKQLDALSDKLAEGVGGQKGEQRDVVILRSLPGVGRIVLATLLAEAGEPLRARDYHALRALCGIAPVTKRSGKSHMVCMRRACSTRLRTATYHWGRVAVQRDPVSREKYAELRKRGHSHGRALRSVVDRLLYVACTMLGTGSVFDENRRVQKAA